MAGKDRLPLLESVHFVPIAPPWALALKSALGCHLHHSSKLPALVRYLPLSFCASDGHQSPLHFLPFLLNLTTLKSLQPERPGLRFSQGWAVCSLVFPLRDDVFLIHATLPNPSPNPGHMFWKIPFWKRGRWRIGGFSYPKCNESRS